jgi:hypothetical protein
VLTPSIDAKRLFAGAARLARITRFADHRKSEFVHRREAIKATDLKWIEPLFL